MISPIVVASRPRVVVSRRLPSSVETQLQQLFDAELNADDVPLDAEAFQQALATADAVVPTVGDRLPGGVIRRDGVRARIIANYGVGTNHIDLDAARVAGIVVTNTPDVLTEDTADLAMMLLAMTARRAGEGERELRDGRWAGWRPTHHLGTAVHGKSLGIVGMGRIGRAVARRASSGFGMRVSYHSRTPISSEDERALGVARADSLDALLARSDFVTLHCPATPETRHLIDSRRLALMQPRAFLINTARGDIVDEAALIDALSRRAIAGAGLDVYEDEPRISAGLLALDSVVLLPHIGSATTESRVAMGGRVLANLTEFFAGREPADRVV